MAFQALIATISETGFDADPVELLGRGVVEVGHGPGERRGGAVEVEPDGDLCRRHGSTLPAESAHR